MSLTELEEKLKQGDLKGALQMVVEYKKYKAANMRKYRAEKNLNNEKG